MEEILLTVFYCSWSIASGWNHESAQIQYPYWQGLPKEFRIVLERQLHIKKPNHDISQPYSIKDVCTAAENQLQRNKFTDMLFPIPGFDYGYSSDSDDISTTEEKSDSESSSSEDSDKFHH